MKHLKVGFGWAFRGWIILKVIKIITTSFDKQIESSQLMREAMIWIPFALLIAAYEYYKARKKVDSQS